MADVKVDFEGKSLTQLYKEGNRACLLKDYPVAIACLSRCTEIAVAERGEHHESLGMLYYSYGRALLESAREDADPLGEAVPKDVAVEAIEEEDLEGEEEEDAEEEDEQAEGDTAEVDGDEKQSEPEQAKSDKDGEGVQGSSKGVEFNGEGEVAGKSSDESDLNDSKADEGEQKAEEGSSEPKEEEPSDLQVAWEVLELAKQIFTSEGSTGKEMLASTLITLGEVSLESENFESAVSDIREGLEIQKTIFDADNRKLAETYYKLGMALATNNQIDDAVETFNKTIEHLNNRIEKLKGSQDDRDKEEVTEMKQLIPEVEEKIGDMKLCKEEASKNTPAVEAEDPPVQPSPEKKANDISHLVKRKRNLNDSSEGSSSPAKKVTPDSS